MLLAGCQSLEMTPENVAQVRVIAASPDVPAMDFYAGSSALAYGVEFGSASSYVPLSAASVVHLSANTANSAQKLVRQKASFAAGLHYTAVVTHVAADLQEAVYTDQTQPAPAGKIDLRIIDASTRSGGVDLYLVPAESTLATTLPVRAGLALGASTGYMEYAAGTYSLVVTAAGTVPSSSPATLLTGPQVTYGSGAVRTIVLVDKAAGPAQPGIDEIVADDYVPNQG